MSLPSRIKSVTLLELLTAVVLVSFVIIGIVSIEIFSRYQVLSSDRRARLQNEVSYALEHIAKNINQAIGSSGDPAVNAYADGNGIRIRIDSSGDGIADSADTWIAYRHENIGSTDSEIRYYSNAGDSETPAGSSESIAKKIVIGASGLVFSIGERSVEILIVCRFNPAQSASVDNPEVTMRTKIDIPAVSIN